MRVISRRLGDEVDPSIMRLINYPRGNQILEFPSEGSVSLAEFMKELERQSNKGRECRGREESGSDGAGEQGAAGGGIGERRRSPRATSPDAST